MPIHNRSVPELLRNEKSFPESLLGLPRRARAANLYKNLSEDTVYGFYLGKETRSNKIVSLRSGSVKVQTLGIRHENLCVTNDFVLENVADRLYLPEGWSYTMVALEPNTSIEYYTERSIERLAPPKLLDPFDPDLGYDWGTRKVEEYEELVSLQNYCNRL